MRTITSEAGQDHDEQIPPIDFGAAKRLGERWRWLRKDQNTSTQDRRYYIPSEPDPKARILAEGVSITAANHDNRRRQEPDLEQIKEYYSYFEHGNREKIRKTAESKGIRDAELIVRNFTTQEAILSLDHPLYAQLHEIANRITLAEKALLKRELLTRKIESGDYEFYISKRNEVNAFTICHGKKAFFEAGLITLFDQYLRTEKGYGLS